MTAESTAAIASAAPAQSVDIPAVVAGLRKTFATGRTRPVEWRRTQLRALEHMIADNEARIAEALATDLGRKPFEAWLADIASTTAEARDAAKNVGKWTDGGYRLLEVATARPGLDRVRAVRHRARHRCLELPVRADAGARRRRHRRGKHRGHQAV